MKANGGCFTNAFLFLGVIAFTLTLTYRLGFLNKGVNIILLPDPDPEGHINLYYWPPGNFRYEVWHNGN